MCDTYTSTAECGLTFSFHSTIGTRLSTLLSAVTGISRRMRLCLRQRMASRRIERFSDHRLRDIGFERDWDGSMIARHK
ncbi:hypothetical protein V2V90_24390 (plasmid) [Agrobacterium leguminum]|uniref:hypothetical protein n=1 Tax=Agrobacterium leguminum TaxID=2792015 RepID=UPI0030CB86C0